MLLGAVLQLQYLLPCVLQSWSGKKWSKMEQSQLFTSPAAFRNTVLGKASRERLGLGWDLSREEMIFQPDKGCPYVTSWHPLVTSWATLDVNLELTLCFKVLCLCPCVFRQEETGLGVLSWDATEGLLKRLQLLLYASARENYSLGNHPGNILSSNSNYCVVFFLISSENILA